MAEPGSTEVIDAHVHFWNPEKNPWYPFLRPYAESLGVPAIANPFSWPDYEAAVASCTLPYLVMGLVHVNATSAPADVDAETEWVSDLLNDCPVPSVLVGSVDPAADPSDITAQLDRLAKRKAFRGVRVYLGLSPDLPAARTIAHWLHEHHAVFDLVSGGADMAAWARLLEPLDGLRVVLEHSASPTSLGGEVRDLWEEGVRIAAGQAWDCKLSVWGMHGRWSRQKLEPWLDALVAQFGWERLLFGSNSPIDRAGGAYSDMMATLEETLAATSASGLERAGFFAGNARRAYRMS